MKNAGWQQFCLFCREKFSVKVFVYILSGMLVVFGAVIFYVLSWQQSQQQAQLLSQGLLMTRLLAHNARLGVFTENEQQLRLPAQAVLRQKGVRGVCIYSGDGDHLLHLESTENTGQIICRPMQGDFAVFDRIRAQASAMYEAHDGIFEFWAPVFSSPPRFTGEELFLSAQPSPPQQEAATITGFVGLSINAAVLDERQKEMLASGSGVVFLFLLMIGLVTMFIVRAVTGPLNTLVAKVRQRGETENPAGDDLGLLDTTFESMLSQLDDQFVVVNNLQADLERQVELLEHEIGERRAVETALRTSEKKYRTLVETVNDAVYTLDDRGIVSYVSPTVENVLGYPPGEITGRNFLELIAPVGRERVAASFRAALLSGQPSTLEVDLQGRNGRIVPVEVNGTPLFDGQGNMVGRLGIARDISQRRRAEKERQDLEIKALAQSKQASLGEIATGIAHEVNQPLSFIKIIFESTLRDLRANRLDHVELEEDFLEAIKQVGRITAIINHLRTYGRADATSFSQTALGRVLDDTLILMGERLKLRNITLRRETAPDLPWILADSIKLEQVFINLFQNSIDALEGRPDGVISVRMLGNHQTDTVRIEFLDNGPGIPPEALARLFEPFFTTKEVGRGTGLGLAIARSIIREHGGTIHCQPQAEGGAFFEIVLPVTPPGQLPEELSTDREHSP